MSLSRFSKDVSCLATTKSGPSIAISNTSPSLTTTGVISAPPVTRSNTAMVPKYERIS